MYDIIFCLYLIVLVYQFNFCHFFIGIIVSGTKKIWHGVFHLIIWIVEQIKNADAVIMHFQELVFLCSFPIGCVSVQNLLVPDGVFL